MLRPMKAAGIRRAKTTGLALFLGLGFWLSLACSHPASAHQTPEAASDEPLTEDSLPKFMAQINEFARGADCIHKANENPEIDEKEMIRRLAESGHSEEMRDIANSLVTEDDSDEKAKAASDEPALQVAEAAVSRIKKVSGGSTNQFRRIRAATALLYFWDTALGGKCKIRFVDNQQKG